MPNRVAIYARVSTDEQAEEGHSIDAQIRLCREFCALKGWTVVGEYIDAGVSGTTTRRPEFQRMLLDAHNGKIDLILVHKLDRFSRSLVDTLTTLAHLSQRGITFCSVTESQFDFSTVMGKIILAVLAGLAEMFIENLRAETKKGKRERAHKGFYNGVVPFGYQAVSKADGGIPIPHPQNADAYRRIISELARGQSAAAIAKALNADGFRTTGNRGANLFTGDSIIDIARNRFHLGQVSYKEVWREGKHAPLIDLDTWELAQKQMRQRAAVRDTGKHSTAREYPLRKIIYCADCGTALRGQASHGVRHYKDMQAARKLCHAAQLVNAANIENQLGAYFDALILPEDWREQILARHTHTDRAQVQNKRRALQGQLTRARELYIAGDLDRAAWLSKKQTLEGALAALPVTTEAPTYDNAAALLQSIGSLWHAANPRNQADLAASMLARVYVRQNKIVAIEPRAAFADLFAILQNEKPPSDIPDDGFRNAFTGATGVNPSNAFRLSFHDGDLEPILVITRADILAAK